MTQGNDHVYAVRASVLAGLFALAGIGGVLASGAGAAGTGGATYVSKPKIKRVRCAAGCASHGRVRNGGTVTVRGKGLADATRVVFLGGRGRADDVGVKIKAASDKSVAVRVPYSADSGPISAWASKSVRSKPSKPLKIVPAPPPRPSPQLTPAPGPAQPGAPKLSTALSSGSVFVAGRGVGFSYRIDGGGPADVTVSLVRLSDSTAIKTWTAAAVATGAVQTIGWNDSAPDGRYAFRLTARGGNGATAANAAPGDVDRDAFELHGYRFPLAAKHSYGDGFGAARGGHSHEGQDIFAKCGTPIYAARGGKVKVKQFQSAAGNYVVIDGAGTGQDHFYAHLRSPSKLDEGDRVATGEQIGQVGDTGDAVGCHLHFEIWSSPGWYSGGHAINPLKQLKRWDRYS